MDPLTGVEQVSYLSYEVGSYVTPRVTYNRMSGELLVLEYQAPFRYTVVSQNRLHTPRTGRVVFGGEDVTDAGRVLLGVYPLDA